MYAQPRDINELRRLLAMGAIPEDQPIRGSLGPGQAPDPQVNELARILSEQEQFAQGGGEGPLPMGSMRNEQTGAVTYFKPGGGEFSRQPYPQQAAQQPRAKVRVVGAGLDGSMTDLGEEDARALPIDNTRPGIEIPGLGRGRYTADGRYAVIANPDGSQTKVVLGYDAAASERGQVRNMKMREMELDNAMREEQLGAMRDRRQMMAAGPAQTMTDANPELVAGAGVPQSVLEKQFGKAPANKRWNASGQLEDLPGASTKVTDARDVLSILDLAEPLLSDSTGSYGGFAIDKLMQLFGSSTQGAKASAQLKALQGALVSKMPKMTGPQSDKDVLLYREMAGEIGDPTIPAEQKRAAMQTIRRLNEQYSGGAPAAASAAPKRIELDAMPMARDYAGKLLTMPNGTKYRSDGATWVRQ